MKLVLANRAMQSCFLPSLAILILILLGCVHETSTFLLNDTPPRPLRVASFNIRRFGRTVMSKTDVVANIIRVLRRYDIVFVMETRDATGTALDQLWKQLGADQWNFTASVPVGRSVYKEQYVYFYRPAAVNLVNTLLYNDTAKDVFDREPYMAQFQYWSHAAGSEAKVTFVGAHLDPHEVVPEMEGLPDVISSAQRVFPDSGGVITMGDFNADCNYLNGAERASVTLLNSPDKYTSFVPDSWDTTVSSTNCAYDRLILTAAKGQPEVKVADVKVFNFEKDLGLSYDDAYGVSDHFPLEFTLE